MWRYCRKMRSENSLLSTFRLTTERSTHRGEQEVSPGPIPHRKLKAFFWEPLPDNRIPGTFWEACPPLVQPVEAAPGPHGDAVPGAQPITVSSFRAWLGYATACNARHTKAERLELAAAAMQAHASSALPRQRGHVKLAVLDMRRATAIGVRMSKMR